jgi:sugar transferase (PEP-CTERM/EpsH1 system associated)
MHVLNRWATGGTETVVSRITQRLGDGFEHVICSVHKPDNEAPPCAPSVKLLSLERQTGSRNLILLELVKIMRREKPDVVHSRNWGTIEAILAGKLVGIPAVIHSEHGRNIDTMNSLPWRQRYFRSLCYAFADELFAVSDELKEFYLTQLGRAATRMRVLENGIDVDVCRPDSASRQAIRDRLRLSEDTVLIGSVGRFDPIKSLDTLLLAADQLLAAGGDIRVILIGDGPERSMIEGIIRGSARLAGNTVLPGHVSNVNEWLTAFDIFVLPSLSEGSSNTLLEAMASQVACVASSVGGNTSVLHNGASGRLFFPGDVVGLTSILSGLVANSNYRHDLARGARIRVEQRYSMQRMLNDYRHLYEVALERSHNRRARQLAASRGL